ncbi:MAG: ROK family protein [Sphingomonas sp.]|uniref:ROK family protein n=1 Tax=Sphingomonas sp. TaxID=28214 RepID=UPI0025FD7255|nr:ROK family protein [Sphingomonas sp.]MBY0284247.1 ROK family protein [Sphingomonas sp.]
MPLVAGVELGGTKCVCILGTGPDDVRVIERVPTTSPAETLTAIEAVLDGWRGFVALGIPSFGPVGIDRTAPDWGHITATTKPGWSGTDIAPRLAARYDVPVGFDTDVVGAALAEARWGAAQGLADLAYVTIGTGVGVGLIADGKPLSGLTHAELGHIRPRRLAGDVFPGMCSFHGDCVEGLASGPAIAARAGKPGDQLAADDLAWVSVADAIAQLCHILVLTGVPRRIVFGGGVAVGTPHLLPRVRAALVDSLGSYGNLALLGDLDAFIVPAALGDRAGPLGAILLGQAAL